MMTWIYIHFYTDRKTADIFKYFDDSKIMFDSFKASPIDYLKMQFGIQSEDATLSTYYNKMVAWYDSDLMYNDNRLIIRLNCLLRFISNGNFFIHTVFMSFISLYGLTCLFKLFASEIKEKYFAIFCAVFLMPSVMFWGSGVLKDGVILFALGVFLFNFNKLLNNSANLNNKILFALALLLMLAVKIYVIAIMFPGLLMLILVKRSTNYNFNKLKYWFAIYVFIAICIYSMSYITPINVVEIISLKQHQFMNLAHAVGSGSLLNMPELSNLESVLYGLPHALFNLFFKPLFFDSTSPVIVLAGLENLIIIFTITFSLFMFKIENIYSTPYFFFCIFYTLILYCLIGLIVPVSGALVRYKTAALPFLAVAMVIMIDKAKVSELLTKLKLMP